MKLAALQFAARPGDVDGNLGRLRAAAGAAAAAGADLLVAPELAVTGYGAAPGVLRLAAAGLDGPIATALAGIARESGVALVAGFPERREGALLNSALFTDGRRRVAYAKRRLWGEHERAVFVPGPPGPTVVEHAGLRIALLICYDLEFPELAREAALAGADLIAAPTALPEGPDAEVIAGPMVRVRAFENQVFVAYVGHCGSDGRFAYAGLSHVAAPDAGTLARAGRDETLLMAEIAPADFAASQERNRYLADRGDP